MTIKRPFVMTVLLAYVVRITVFAEVTTITPVGV